MKKLTILFALLCASVMGFAAIDWSGYDYLADGAGGGAYSNKYKVAPAAGQNVVNIQQPGWASEPGIYTSDFGGAISSCSLGDKCAIDGGGVVLYLSAFTAKETEVTIVAALGTKTFTVYYADGTTDGGGSGSSDGSESNSDPEQETALNSYTAGGHTISLDASYVVDGDSKNYTLVITSADAMEGLGGSFWNVNGVGADMRNNMTISDDKKTLTCTATSSSNPDIYTPLYVLMPGEVNFGSVTLNWVNRTPIISEYCNYQGQETQQDNHYYSITWETDANGNVVITIGDGTGAGACSFRNGGFEGGNNGLDNFVVSDDNFATTVPASNYFTVTRPADGDLQYVLTKTTDLPANAKIKHLSDGAIAWREDGTDRWCFPEFIYTYGGTCNQVDSPTNVAVDANNIITFNAVNGADSYTAYVSLNGVHKYSQAVASGDELKFVPLVDGAYDVTVVASGEGKVDSEPSYAFVWNLEAVEIVLGDSEYCEHVKQVGTNTEAAFTWETDASGNVVITIFETLGGATDATHFRENAFALANFKVGTGKEEGSNYFSHPGITKSNQLVLTATNAPVPGEKIYYKGIVEYATSGDGNAYPTLDFEWTYGTVCTGKPVSATANNNTMGSAVVKSGDEEVSNVEEGTPVTFIATVADPELYRFVNWTKGGTEVSTDATYATTITETTNLVANFDYIRNAYCHTAITSVQGKKFYLTLAATGNANEYMIKFEGSNEAKITGINNANFAINNVCRGETCGNDIRFTHENETWTFNAAGYGSVQLFFDLQDGKTWEDIYAWDHFMYLGCEGIGEQNLGNVFPDRYHIAWNNTCSDVQAPVMASPTAAVLNSTDVRLTLSAVDNWEGTIMYNINYKPTDVEGDGTDVSPALIAVSGETITKDITGLNANTEYTFTITATDEAGNTCVAQSCTATPSGDAVAPTGLTITATPLSSTVVRLSLFANDNYAGDISYAVSFDNEGAAATSAPRGEIATLDIIGLTANTEYHFRVTATDAAGNTSTEVNTAVQTFAANIALNRPCTAGHETDNAGEAKGKSNDGDKASRWSSYGSTNKGTLDTEDWWAVELDAVYDIRNLRLSWQDARSDNLNVYTSMDGSNWTLVQNFNFMPESSANGETYTNYQLTNAIGRFVKVLSLHDSFNGQWGISFWEFEAYGYLAADAVAPVISSFNADGASSTSVLLKATADDNFNGNLTYTFYCNDVAQPDPVVQVAGQEVSYMVGNLTMGTNYNFKVVVSDGTNSTTSNVVVSSPIGDTEAPTNVSAITKSVTDNAIVLSMYATDNLGGLVYYTVTAGQIVKNAQAMSGETVDITFDELNYSTTYNFSIVAKDGSNNAAAAVAHSETTLRASYPTIAAPTPAFSSEHVAPVYSSAYSKDCNFADWGGSTITKETFGAKKNDREKEYFGIVDFGTISVNADDELYMYVWTDQDNIRFRVVPIIRNADDSGNLPERGAFTQPLVGGQWNEVHFKMSDFVLDNDNVADPNGNYERIYQIKIDRAGNQTFWLDNIYFSKRVVLNEATLTQDALEDLDGHCLDVDINRSMPADSKFKTICFPFSMSADQVVETFGECEILQLSEARMKSESEMYIRYAPVTSVEAGYPYLITLLGSDKASLLFNGVTINSSTLNNTITVALDDTRSVEMVGTFVNLPRSSDSEFYLDAEDNLLHSIGEYCAESGYPTLTIPAFRCYFRLVGFSNPASVRARVTRAPEVATEVEETLYSAQATKQLRDGQLLIIRNGVSYTVTGLRVE